MSNPRLVIVETSHQPGVVALAAGDHILGERPLDAARQHARDLAPAVAALLAEQGWRARQLDGVVVSLGPGSYTGLRVGVMSAKTLAHATGCRLLAVETFAAIARQAPSEAEVVDVIADAQQDKLYVQRYQSAPGRQPATPLRIMPFADWAAELTPGAWVTGPGLAQHGHRLPASIQLAPAAERHPRAAGLVALGWERWQRGEGDDPMALQPLYLRPSSAEEKWTQRR
ncbi:MAG: tRNA (adenosine(37)-N6)-threonylcarbamoyltransferase complex dimerization subunit type 1 TsaB [Gemmataceae bacterium]|nr:tRNA (adenosine(37)-N6)-threonylcarbamoyltransferase complex dimerization subunit type 1 TsaB [Gemmataceae bacterium]